jgi:glycosyltransferase involved in cell wall biosynthesis
MRVPKMVKNGFNSVLRVRVILGRFGSEWKSGTSAKTKMGINTIFDQFRNRHARARGFEYFSQFLSFFIRGLIGVCWNGFSSKACRSFYKELALPQESRIRRRVLNYKKRARVSIDPQRHKLAKKEVVIVKNYYPLERDPRLIKLLKMLKKEKYRIKYLGWDRSFTSFSPKHINCKSYRATIMQKRAPFGPKSFLYLPLWWLFVLIWLLRSEWDVVHVVNFPSITPAILAAKLKNKPVIYDIEDTTVDQLPLPNFLRILGIQIDKLHMKYVDALVLVDEMQVEEFRGVPNSNFVVIYDSPPLISSLDHPSLKKDVFEIFYAGYLDKERRLNMNSLLEAIEEIEDVKVIIAGEGDLVEEIKIKAYEMPDKIQYIGWIPYDKVLKMSCQADLLFSLRDPCPLVQKYICGSKFLEAVMCGKPIIVNKGTSAAVKVTTDKCGVVVDAHNVSEVKEAILKLKNRKDLCAMLGMNGRRAYQQKYGWEVVQQRLLTLYSKISQ